jgi:hypothetical protein
MLDGQQDDFGFGVRVQRDVLTDDEFSAAEAGLFGKSMHCTR